MQLKKCSVGAKSITVAWLDKDGVDMVEKQIECDQKPAPEFDQCLDKLKGVAEHITDFPAKWAERTKTRVDGLTVSTNKHGARSVKLHLRSTLKAGVVWTSTLPVVRIDDAEPGESGVKLGVSQEDADLIKAFIHEAEAYTDPENRSQQTFLSESDPEEDEEEEKTLV